MMAGVYDYSIVARKILVIYPLLSVLDGSRLPVYRAQVSYPAGWISAGSCPQAEPVTPAVRVKRMASSIFIASGRTALRGISTA